MEKDYYDDQNTMHDPCPDCGSPIGMLPGLGIDCTYCMDKLESEGIVPLCHYCELAEDNELVIPGPIRDGCDCDKCITPIGWKEYALGISHSLLVLAIIALIVSIWFR